METTSEHQHKQHTATDRQPRKQKLTAVLDRERSVSTTGVDSTMEAFIAAISELLRRALSAKKQNVQLPTFLAICRDQSRRY